MDDYAEDLKRRQKEHLDKVRMSRGDYQPTSRCLHDGCPECIGTGVKRDGTPCVHSIACLCHKCRPG